MLCYKLHEHHTWNTLPSNAFVHNDIILVELYCYINGPQDNNTISSKVMRFICINLYTNGNQSMTNPILSISHKTS